MHSDFHSGLLFSRMKFMMSDFMTVKPEFVLFQNDIWV